MNEQNESAEKTLRIKEVLVSENFGGVLLNAQHNFSWLTGGKSNKINASTENGSCFLLVRNDGKKFVLANNIEMPRILDEEISAAEYEPVKFAWEAEKASGDFIIEKAKSLIEKDSELVSDLFLNSRIRPVENLISPYRYWLTSSEIERYRALSRDAGKAISGLFKNINPGETEIEIARKVEEALAAFKISPVITLVGADERIEKFRHPVPTGNRWRKILMVAICGKRQGLITSLSRLACAGEIPSKLQRKTEAVSRVHAALLSSLQSGISGAELYQTAKNAYDNAGFIEEIYKHHQGGAIGYKTREWTAHLLSNEIVQPNQAFAWNPTITGTKSEETVLVKNDGIEILTSSPDFPSLQIESNKQVFSLPGILRL